MIDKLTIRLIVANLQKRRQYLLLKEDTNPLIDITNKREVECAGKKVSFPKDLGVTEHNCNGRELADIETFLGKVEEGMVESCSDCSGRISEERIKAMRDGPVIVLYCLDCQKSHPHPNGVGISVPSLGHSRRSR